VPPPDDVAGPAIPVPADPARRPGGQRSPQGFRYLDEELRCAGWRVNMVNARFESPRGTVFDRDIVRHPGAVAVVPVTDAGTVMLVRQYRGALDRELLEIPAGTRDVDGEPPETTAGRELEEEVGVRARHLRLLATTANTPGFCDELTIVYLATGLEPVPPSRHGEEEDHLEVVELALADVDVAIGRGDVIDAQTIIGLLLARDALAGAGR
jgi:8-oxo-dGTP pyrophosphatase MutT (NUDIX family)